MCVLQLSARRGHSAKPEREQKKSLDSYRPLGTEYQRSTQTAALPAASLPHISPLRLSVALIVPSN